MSPAKFTLPKARWLVPALLAAIVLAGFWLRASDLRADPPHYLSWSFAIYSDEAHNNYSGRNLALQGQWKTDDYLPLVVYPLTNLAAAGALKVFGVGLPPLKFFSVCAGAAAVLLVFLLVWKAAGNAGGLVAGLATACCYPLVMFSRLGLAESAQILFLLLTGWLLVLGLERPKLAILSGFFAAGTGLFVKASGLFVLVAAAAAIGWELVERRRSGRPTQPVLAAAGWWGLGIAAAGLCWLALVFLPHRADYVKYVVRHSVESPTGHPGSLLSYLLNTFSVGGPYAVGVDPLPVFFDTFRMREHFWLFPKAPFVAGAGFLLLPVFGTRAGPGMRYLFCWFVAGVLMLGYMNYHPPRYEVMLLVPMVCAGALGLSRVVATGVLVPRAKPGWFRSGLYCLWLWPFMLQLAVYSRGGWGVLRNSPELVLPGVCLAASAAAVGLGHLVLRLVKAGVVLRPAPLRLALAAVVVLLVLRLDLVQYFGWYGSRKYSLVSNSRRLDRLLPENAVLAGFWAPALLVESRKRALFVSEQWSVNVEDPVAEYGVTHVVQPVSQGSGFFGRRYPELMQGAVEVARCVLPSMPLAVYELSVAGSGM